MRTDALGGNEIDLGANMPAVAKTIQAIKAVSPDGVPCFVGEAAVLSKEPAFALRVDEWTGNVDRLVDSLKRLARRC